MSTVSAASASRSSPTGLQAASAVPLAEPEAEPDAEPDAERDAEPDALADPPSSLMSRTVPPSSLPQATRPAPTTVTRATEASFLRSDIDLGLLCWGIRGD